VLIAAKLLAKTHPAIALSHLYTERSLKRKIAVPLADNRSCYIEPDASVEFLLTETWHEPPQTWQDFFHIEVYRHLPMESHFKQKVRGYVVSVDTGIHEALFKTERCPLRSFAKPSRRHRYSNAGLKTHSRKCNYRKKGSGFTSPAYPSQQQARLTSFSHLSGSGHLARPKHRFSCWNDKMTVVRTCIWRRYNAGVYNRLSTRSTN
jgi:hypothetical protein